MASVIYREFPVSQRVLQISRTGLALFFMP